MIRWAVRALGACVFVAASLVVFALRDIGGAAGPPLDGRLRARAIAGTVDVVRDPFGVPHLSAERLADGMFGLGFVHAQDRLFQMELLRRTAAGRLAEIFGPSALAKDRLVRTLGLRHAAELEADRLGERDAALLGAYAAGVNRWIEELRSRPEWAPPELDALGIEPEPWTAVDSIAIVRLRAWLLSRSFDASLVLERLKRELGGPASQVFFPEQPEPAAATLVGALGALGDVQSALAETIGMRGPVGSLGFLIGSRVSTSGRPILANDPHFELELPSLFYFAHVETSELSVAGGTWPGVPVFWMGNNRRIAWGQVGLHVRVSDLFFETLDPEDRLRFRERGRWREATVRREEIVVRWGEPQVLEIVATHHGPLLGEILPERPELASYALRFTGAHEDSGVSALLRTQQASSWESFRGALRSLPGPPATFLYADIGGRIGTQVAGHLPVRPVPAGLLPLPGDYDWSGMIDFDQLPSTSGQNLRWRVVSPRGDGTPFPGSSEWLWDDGGAAKRLQARIQDSETVSLEDVLALERETFSSEGSARARTLVEAVQPTSDAARRTREMLLRWDGDTGEASRGASVYHVFRERLSLHVLDTRIDASLRGRADLSESERARLRGELAALLAQADDRGVPRRAIDRFFERMLAAEAAGIETSISPALVDRALTETWTWLGERVSGNPERWTWGEVRGLTLEHPFDTIDCRPLGWRIAGWLACMRIRFLGRSLGRGPFPAPGDPDSVWSMYYDRLPRPTLQVGPGARYAVDLGDVHHAHFGLAGGQSGYPGSRHYDDGLAEWLRGRPRPLWMHRVDVAYHQAGRWELLPDSRGDR